MDIKKLTSQMLLAQSLLSASGLLTPKSNLPAIRLSIGYYGAAIIFFLILSIGFLFGGFYMYLISFLPLYQVLLIMGGTSAILTVLIILAKILVFYIAHRKVKKSINHTYDSVQGVFEEIAVHIEKPISENPKTAISLAILAGFILSQKILDR